MHFLFVSIPVELQENTSLYQPSVRESSLRTPPLHFAHNCMMMATKPGKQLTYTIVERDIFVEPMSKYTSVIENKKPYKALLNLKAQTWEKLSRV